MRESTQVLFWHAAGEEFRLACESRFVDCAGMPSFEEELPVTRSTYDSDSTIPSFTIPFDDAWTSVERIVRRLERDMVVPLHFPLI